MNDQEIIDLYFGRNEQALVESERQYGKYCSSIAFRILENHEDTEECVNETWLHAWNTIPPSKPNRLSLFLGKITRNLAFDKIKMKRAAKRGNGEIYLVLDELDECIPSAHDTEQKVLDQELAELINKFLYTLSAQDCNIFLLRYWYNYPLKKIAEKYLMKENNVKANLFRNRKKLKIFLEKEGVVL